MVNYFREREGDLTFTDHYRIIIVEDDHGLNKLIQKKLKKQGFTFSGAYNGLEAIQLVNEYPHSLLILDYKLTDMNGKKLIETLLKKDINVPFVMMTANKDINIALEMMKLGAIDYIIKDHNLLDLISTKINSALKQLETENQLAHSYKKLKESENRYRELIDLLPDAVLVYNDSGILYCNNEGANLLKIETAKALDGTSIIDFTDSKNKEEAKKFLPNLNAGDRLENKSYFTQDSFYRSDGKVLDLEVKASPIAFNSQFATIAIIRDLTEYRATEETLRESLNQIELLSSAVNKVNAGVVITDPKQEDNPIIYANPYFYDMSGYPPDEVLGRNCRFLQGEDTNKNSVLEIRKAIENCEPITAEIINYRKNGELFWNELQITPIYNNERELTHYIGLQRDISDRKEAENQIEKMAYKDELTGLPNRRFFHELLSEAIKQRSTDDNQLVIIMIDLDRFKMVNDSLGHNAGDIILKELASRLKQKTPENSTLARLGGDEFILLIPSLTSRKEVITVCNDFLDVVKSPFYVEGRKFNLTISIGLSVYPENGEDNNMLVKNADIAMYRAKEQGRNMYEWFTASMNDNVIEKLNIEETIRKGLANDEFILHYQSKFNLNERAPYGVEALVRMLPSDNDLILPGIFIPVAEETGLIMEVGEWVLREACKQNKAWQDQGYPPMLISVNLSAKQFIQDNLIDQVERILNETGLEPEWLELELTESIIMRNLEETTKKLKQLKSMGISISIDDFGTGFSSLSYLKNFPIDILKIDQSFMKDVHKNTTNQAIVRSIISLGKSLQMKIIAEGVEQEEQIEFLKKEHCESAQGYLLHKPCDGRSFKKFLEERTN